MVHLFGIHVFRGRLTCQCYVDEVLHRHVMLIYQIVGKAARQCPTTYLQYGKELFASQSYQHSRLAIQIPCSILKHLWDILGWGYVTCIPSQLPHYSNWKAGWLNNSMAFHRVIYAGFFSACPIDSHNALVKIAVTIQVIDLQ